MKPPPRSVPWLVASSVVALACLLTAACEWFPRNVLRSLDLDIFDWAMRSAAEQSEPPAPSLIGVYLDEHTVTNLSSNYQLDFPYPRWVHGRVFRELNSLGVRGVGFDILFNERRHDVGSPYRDIRTRSEEPSDEFLARQFAEFGNAVIAGGPESSPAPLFRTNAAAVAHIVAHRDHDGVLRRVEPFITVDGVRRWTMGIALVALVEGWDLDSASMRDGQLHLTSTNSGRDLTIPVDRDGKLIVDWSIGFEDERITRLRYDQVLIADDDRQWAALAADAGNPAQSRESTLPDSNAIEAGLAIIGSVAEGNNVSDLGTTPLSINTPLVITHLNVANMLLSERFVRETGLAAEFLLVLLLATLTALTTLKTRPIRAGLAVATTVLVLIGLSYQLFIHQRIWLPVSAPVVAGLVLPYLTLATYRLMSEESEQKRIKSVFTRLVSPNVVQELLTAERLSLGGARREVTVMFADIRGFTQMTDARQSQTLARVRAQNLSPEEAEGMFNQNAAAVLETVNSYLSIVADVVKRHDGTLDKYIGDCVMAFWGAPTPNSQHARSCVLAAIDTQRAIHRFNRQRQARNQQLAETGNSADPLDLLSLGTGINSGMATVGLMGSQEHISNYTVFGSTVNLASRLETLSGRSRIYIGEQTFQHLRIQDPELAATCQPQPPTHVKGIKEPITYYEVPWTETAAEIDPSKL